jgi:hypothetical protein
MLAYGMNITPDEATFMRLIIDGVLSTYTWSYVSIWIAAVAGLGLGALGGLLAGAGGAPQSPMPLLWLAVSAAGILSTAMPTLVSAIVLGLLGPSTQQAADQIGYAPFIPSSIILTLAMLTNFAMLVAWQVIGWFAVKRAQVDNARDHTTLVITAIFNGIVPFILAILLLLLGSESLLNVATIVGLLVSLAVGAITLRLGWALRSQPKPPVRSIVVQPHVFGWTAFLTGLTMIFNVYASPTAASLNLVLLVIPFISVLALHDPAALAEPLAQGQSVGSLVSSNYMMHAVVIGYGEVFVFAITLIVFALAWLFRRWQLGRAATST